MQPYWLHAYLLVYVPVGLYADTKATALWQQDVLGALTFVALYLAALKAPPGSRAQVWVCVAVATCFEVFASLVWGIYRYRMHNLPLFVPPGHGMVYLFGVLAAQTPIVRRLGRKLAYGVLAVACAWSFAGLTVLPAFTGRFDLQGAMCLPVLAWFLLRSPRWPLFAGIFVIVAELEIFGTSFGSWTWTQVAPWTGVPSGNPPSAIAAGYGVIDGTVLALCALGYRLGLNTIIARMTTTMMPRPGPNLRLKPASRAYSGDDA